VRERIPEMAVLKTLGFSNGQVTGLVVAEALLLCLIGGLLGMSLSSLAISGMAKAAPAFFGALSPDPTIWLQAIAAMLLLALVVGLPPALRVARLKIVDALAGR
jgi:putative ABC transport system permease protein